jgi:hypothetical protein
VHEEEEEPSRHSDKADGGEVEHGERNQGAAAGGDAGCRGSSARDHRDDERPTERCEAERYAVEVHAARVT